MRYKFISYSFFGCFGFEKQKIFLLDNLFSISRWYGLVFSLDVVISTLFGPTTNYVFMFLYKKKKGHPNYRRYWPLQLERPWYHLLAFPLPLSSSFIKKMTTSPPPPMFPMSNTCVNCIKLPLHGSYHLFKEKFDFALGNACGFGRE